MRILRCQDGAALVTALMLTMLSLVIALALLSTVTTGTRISASQKRYRSALAAANGGVELLNQEIIPRLLQMNESQYGSVETQFSEINLHLQQSGCLKQKLNQPTYAWNACDKDQSSSDPANSPDATFRLNGPRDEAGFRVSTKIVDTVPGNSDKNSVQLLDTGSSVAGDDEGIIRPRHVPGLYNLTVQGVREGGESRERARLSVLYAY